MAKYKVISKGNNNSVSESSEAHSETNKTKGIGNGRVKSKSPQKSPKIELISQPIYHPTLKKMIGLTIEIFTEKIVSCSRPRVTRYGGVYYSEPYNSYYKELQRQLKLIPKTITKELYSKKPLIVDITFLFTIPSSYNEKQRESALKYGFQGGRVIDIDNLSKWILDSANKNIYSDDSSIVELRARKLYTEDNENKIVFKVYKYKYREFLNG